MALIDVPGDELMRVHALLQRTKDMMDTGLTAALGDQIAALGHEELQAASYDFERSWADGRTVVGRDLEGVRDAAKAVVDAFAQTDQATVDALTAPGAEPQ
jgi:predicted lipid-binding transport protein (Tim44 family)